MQADVVKKANLKLKVVRNKTGSCAAGLQGVRNRCSFSLPSVLRTPRLLCIMVNL